MIFKHIWVGTFKGIDCYDPITDTLESLYALWKFFEFFKPYFYSLSSLKICKGNIWVGTYYGSEDVFNPDKE